MIIMTASCNNDNKKEEHHEASAKEGTYGFDRQFLTGHDSTLVQLQSGESSILVSPRYQAKVFTSTAAGDEGKSFGWINYKMFGAPEDPHMNGYGGENRLWLGPEGGKSSLFFKNGDSMVFSNWKTPKPFDTESWDVVNKDEHSVTMKKDMSLTNFTGTHVQAEVTRSIAILGKTDIEKTLPVELGDSINFVGYSTSNILKNTGDQEWTEKTGMPIIWILDMFNPSESTTIVIPYKPAPKDVKVATTNYFGEIANDRILFSENTIFFKADGKSRGKLGVLPQYVLPFAGSYDNENNVLTVTSFSVDNNAKYLNNEWNILKPVFSGDAMNVYNDGPLDNGSQMGPFYELESVSPAAALKPGAEIVHTHNVYHFTGNRQQLDNISRKVFGVSLETIQQAFKK